MSEQTRQRHAERVVTINHKFAKRTDISAGHAAWNCMTAQHFQGSGRGYNDGKHSVNQTWDDVS